MTTQREKHKSVKLESILKARPVNNYVLCKRIGDNINTPTEAGLYKVTQSFHKDQWLMQNVERVFEVVAPPEMLTEVPGYWKTKIDVKIGDKVIVQALDSLESKVVFVDGQEYRLILYYKIITAIRGKKIIPVNGYILFTRVLHDEVITMIEKGLSIPESLKKKEDPRYGRVEYVSPKNYYYLKEKNIDSDKDVNVERGDKIIFIKPINLFAPVLENKMHRILDKEYYYCQRSRIGGKFGRVTTLTLN